MKNESQARCPLRRTQYPEVGRGQKDEVGKACCVITRQQLCRLSLSNQFPAFSFMSLLHGLLYTAGYLGGSNSIKIQDYLDAPISSSMTVNPLTTFFLVTYLHVNPSGIT